MGAVVGLTVIKKMTYRGNANEEWSNQYWFSGAVPADGAAWTALFGALITQEKTLYAGGHSIVAGYGYDSDADNAHAVWVHDISGSPVAGTLAPTSGKEMPGDDAGLLSWKTSRSNTRGKPIYLRKYYHGVWASSVSTVDSVQAQQLSAYDAFAQKMYDGTFIDGRVVRSRKHAETLLNHVAHPWVTTRTLKRRGKRPS